MKYLAAAGGLALLVFMAFTCETADVETGCALPEEGSIEARKLEEGRRQAGFDFLYPCRLPNSQRLTNVAVLGDRGKQSVTLSYEGPFELSIQQSQIIPVVAADPSGASHIVLRNFLPGVDADLIEINEGASRAIYRLVWDSDGIHYEIAAAGPPLQRRTVLDIARGLE